MQQLPEEVFEEILSRLPVKDLARFKSVCKNWKSIISSQHFIQFHLKKSISSTSNRRIFMPYRDTYKTIGHSKDLHAYVKEQPMPEETIGALFLGNSDGFCRTVLFFWFGQESSDDEYKVVLGVRSSEPFYVTGRENILGEEYRNRVYLIKPFSDDRKRPEPTQEIDDPSYFRSYDEGILMNEHGIVHWLTRSPRISCTVGSAYRHAVFTYNLRNKTLGKMPTPVGLNSRGAIGIIDGCFSALIIFSPMFEVWVMKEYGVKESWMMLMTLSLGIDEYNLILSSQRVKLAGVDAKGDLIMSCCTADGWSLLSYNEAENESKILMSKGYGYATMYVETLDFPN